MDDIRTRLDHNLAGVYLAAPLMGLLLLVLATWGLARHVYLDRSSVPDLEPFIRFELSTIGKVYDSRGTVLVELAREYRQIVSYEEVPPVLRHAILAAEDKNFFDHSGVDYRALPRVLYRTARSSVGAWWNGDGFRLRLPQGGSTLTQQLVRGYFLRERWGRENDSTLFHDNLTSRLISVVELHHGGGRREGSVAGRNHQGAAGLPPGAWRPAATAPPQRDPGPDGAQRLHHRRPREALPGRAGPRGEGAEHPGQDPGPRGDRHRLRRAEAARCGRLRGRGSLPGADLGARHRGPAGTDHRERSARDRPGLLREAAP